METLTAAKVISRVRKRMGVSQEGMSRLLNATKGAVQHWERGRNNPDLARLVVLRQLCPAGPERRELDALMKETQSQVAPMPHGKGSATPIPLVGRMKKGPAGGAFSSESYAMLKREHQRLQKRLTQAESALERRSEQVRILEGLVKELQQEVSRLKASPPATASAAASAGPNP